MWYYGLYHSGLPVLLFPVLPTYQLFLFLTENQEDFKDRPFDCKHCSTRLFGNQMYKEHMKKEHPGCSLLKLKLCSQCPFVANGTCDLLKHSDLHSNPSAVKCPFCPYLARNSNGVDKHLKQCRPSAQLSETVQKTAGIICSISCYARLWSLRFQCEFDTFRLGRVAVS